MNCPNHAVRLEHAIDDRHPVGGNGPAEEGVGVGDDDEGGDQAEEAADEQRADGVRHRCAQQTGGAHAGGRDQHAAHRRRVLEDDHIEGGVVAAQDW